MIDSRPDNWRHINTVQGYLNEVVTDLQERALVHDQSKLVFPEVEVFNEYTSKLKDSTYGSDEYKGFLVGMGEGLKHHYANNDHHPEHFEGGIHDMNLVQIIEMLADWKAATMRHANGDIRKSIEQNAERFGYDEVIAGMLIRTVEYLGWI